MNTNGVLVSSCSTREVISLMGISQSGDLTLNSYRSSLWHKY